MTGWPGRRDWHRAGVAEAAPGVFALVLDDSRPARTPRGAPFRLPSRPLAAAIAAEWEASGDPVRGEAMPLTRLAAAANDDVAPRPAQLATLVAAYGESDLLCYRAEAPADLARRQAELWDPVLGWAAATLAAPLATTAGVMHRAQPEASLAALRAAVPADDPFRLAALAELVALAGSLVLGLAVARGALDGAEAWALSRIDEDWQAARWGEDAEAAAAAARRRDDFLAAERFLRLIDA